MLVTNNFSLCQLSNRIDALGCDIKFIKVVWFSICEIWRNALSRFISLILPFFSCLYLVKV